MRPALVFLRDDDVREQAPAGRCGRLDARKLVAHELDVRRTAWLRSRVLDRGPGVDEVGGGDVKRREGFDEDRRHEADELAPLDRLRRKALYDVAVDREEHQRGQSLLERGSPDLGGLAQGCLAAACQVLLEHGGVSIVSSATTAGLFRPARARRHRRRGITLRRGCQQDPSA